MSMLNTGNRFVKSLFIPMDIARTPLTRLSQSDLNKCYYSHIAYKTKPEFPKLLIKSSELSSDEDTLIENIIKNLRSNPKLRECFGLQRYAANTVKGGVEEGYRLMYKA